MPPPVSGPTQGPNPVKQVSQEGDSSLSDKITKRMMDPKTFQRCFNYYDIFTLDGLDHGYKYEFESNTSPVQIAYGNRRLLYCVKKLSDKGTLVQSLGSSLSKYLDLYLSAYLGLFRVNKLPFFGDMISDVVDNYTGLMGVAITVSNNPKSQSDGMPKSQPKKIPYSGIDWKPDELLNPPPYKRSE